jgi:hypothetical protein
VSNGHLHGQAVWSVAIADTSNERSREGPYAMAEAFLFVLSEACQGLFFGNNLRPLRIRATGKSRAHVLEYRCQFAAIRPQADPITVSLLFFELQITANAGGPHDGIDESENAFYVLNRNNL